METHETNRGFNRVAFVDAGGEECSVQESSAYELAYPGGEAVEGPFLWLGQNSGTHHNGHCLARMHLAREHIQDLIPLLQYWLDNGRLPPSETVIALDSRRGGR